VGGTKYALLDGRGDNNVNADCNEGDNMPTLEERQVETTFDLQTRLQERCTDFNITDEMSQYIEMLEKYLLLLKRRVNYLEFN